MFLVKKFETPLDDFAGAIPPRTPSEFPFAALKVPLA